MSYTSIKIENLSKQYRLGEYAGYRTFREAVVDTMKASLAVFRPKPDTEGLLPVGQNMVWALKDVSVDIEQGEVVGIVGRNGAGKSTLLKILGKITDPTEGRVELRGRVGSLLEVGTGFHPELTGQENIFLYGVILGMSRWEVARKFDEIVAFAELEKFIDTPVKRYSSGMYMRLAFAVAAHLEPEILLVDEVLAVGDAAFQKKCLGKMDDVSKQGRTVLFVSHQLNSVRKLCSRAIWLDNGSNQMEGTAREVVSAYEGAFFKAAETGAKTKQQNCFVGWDILEPKTDNPYRYDTFGPVKIRFLLLLDHEIQRGIHGIALWNSDNILMWGRSVENLHLKPGLNELTYVFEDLPLHPGPYRWQVSFYEKKGLMLDNWQSVPEMIVATEPLGHPLDEWAGILNLPSEFKAELLEKIK